MQKSANDNHAFIRFIAIMQVMTILLVVFGHSLYLHPDAIAGKDILMNKMLFSFRMPTFLFVSGYLMAYTTFCKGKVVNPCVFAKGKFLRLVLPFLLLSSIVYGFRTLLPSINSDGNSLVEENFFNAFLYRDLLPVPYYWFLHTSFMLLVVTYMIIYLAYRRGVRISALIVGLIAVVYIVSAFGPEFGDFLSVDKTVSMAVYFLFGALFANSSDGFIRFIDRTPVTCFFLFFATWMLSYFYMFNTILRPVCSLFGIGMMLSLAIAVSHSRFTMFDHLIGANYIIFLLSWFCNVLSQQILSRYLALPWYVYSILSFVTGVYVPYLFYRWMIANRTVGFVRICAFCLGQNLYRK